MKKRFNEKQNDHGTIAGAISFYGRIDCLKFSWRWICQRKFDETFCFQQVLLMNKGIYISDTEAATTFTAENSVLPTDLWVSLFLNFLNFQYNPLKLPFLLLLKLTRYLLSSSVQWDFNLTICSEISCSFSMETVEMQVKYLGMQRALSRII